jgi:hypothetical protein
MSSAELPDDPERQETAQAENGRDNDSMANKLSKELNNWRRKRTNGRPRRVEGPSQNYQSEPARTIKVRGHETLVVRKPKLASKPPTNPTATE